jgi:hypothetical protein
VKSVAELGGARLLAATHRLKEHTHQMMDRENGVLAKTAETKRPGSKLEQDRSDFAWPHRNQTPSKSWKQIALLKVTECPTDTSADEATMRVSFNRAGGERWYRRERNFS